MNTNDKPLSGAKVIDFSIFVAGASASCMLGYLGADVIKVEPPKGDPYRTSGIGFGMVATEDENALYDTVNSFKRDICINLRTDEGKATMLKLLATADIFVTNYRDKALEAMGLSYEKVKAVNPKIVYAKSGGYGYEGPDKDRPGYDSTAFMARGGFITEATRPGYAPAVTPAAAGDTVTAESLTIGVLAAYVQAKLQGKGSLVTTSLYTSGLWTLASPCVRRQYIGRKKGYVSDYRKPGYLPICCPFLLKGDTWVMFCAMSSEGNWDKFCDALGMEDIKNDPKYTTTPNMIKNATELYAIMEKILLEKTAEEWEPIFLEHDLPYEFIACIEEIVNDEQSLANNYATAINYPSKGDVYMPMPPFKISSMEDPIREKAPRIGENTVEILKEIGMAEGEISKLIEAGAVKQR